MRVSQKLAVSERRACKVLEQSRATQHRNLSPPSDEEQLTEDIVMSDDVRIKYKLLRALDPKQFTEHYVIDDETGEVEETRTGEQIMAERLALLLESNKQDAD